MTEKIIENQILQYLSLVGVFAFKINSTGVYDPIKKVFRKSMNRHHIKGVSDILACIDGRFVAIEVKTPKGRLSPDQDKFIMQVNLMGGLAFKATSVTQVQETLIEHFPKRRLSLERVKFDT